jgi:hypothetical protein
MYNVLTHVDLCNLKVKFMVWVNNIIHVLKIIPLTKWLRHLHKSIRANHNTIYLHTEDTEQLCIEHFNAVLSTPAVRCPFNMKVAYQFVSRPEVWGGYTNRDTPNKAARFTMCLLRSQWHGTGEFTLELHIFMLFETSSPLRERSNRPNKRESWCSTSAVYLFSILASIDVKHAGSH